MFPSPRHRFRAPAALRPGPRRKPPWSTLLPAAAALLLHGLPAAACSTARDCFDEGVLRYQAQHYEAAVERFEQAIDLAPGKSAFHHWLGRSVGRIAERGHWLRAITLAPRVLREFETAVALDGQNVEALQDLATYYRRAPGFLGGSDDKAEALERRLRALAGDGPQGSDKP